MQFKYTLRGATSTIQFVVYGGMNNYLVNHEISTITYTGQSPSPSENNRIFSLLYINNNEEKSEISRLADVIKSITSNLDDQARIAISLVQNIPYNWNSFNSKSNDWKYPYEVLFTDCGVCSDKARLMVCLLRELGYGCVLFDFTAAEHEAVGIKCPSQYAYSGDYAFVESDSPTIITYWKGDYYGGVVLPSSPDNITQMCDGSTFDSISEEYQDAQIWYTVMHMGQTLPEYYYNQYISLVNKYGIHGG